MDTVDRWEASRALKRATDALQADMIRALKEGARPEHVALIFGERLERLLRASGLPIGEAVNEFDVGKGIDVFLDALEGGGFPADGLAEIRVGLGKSPKRTAPAVEDRAVALARVPAIPLPAHFDDPAEALARVPAISLGEHAGEADGRPPTVEVETKTAEGSACAEQTQVSTTADADAGASEVPSHADEHERSAVRTVAKSASAIGIKLDGDDLRVVARVVDHLRVQLGSRARHAARSCGPIHRRPRTSRAPRRAAHRSAVAPARDGPPSSDDAPAPVASRSLSGATGGSR